MVFRSRLSENIANMLGVCGLFKMRASQVDPEQT